MYGKLVIYLCFNLYFDPLDGEKKVVSRKLNTAGRRPAAGNAMWDKRDQESRDSNRDYDRDRRNRDEDERRPRDLRDNIERRRGERGERGRRSSRSRSRSRSRERRAKRRPDSPFTKAHEKWKKFKQAEKVLNEFFIHTLGPW